MLFPFQSPRCLSLGLWCVFVCWFVSCAGVILFLGISGREKVGVDFSSESWNQTLCNQMSECGTILECLSTELDPWPAATPLRLFSFCFLFLFSFFPLETFGRTFQTVLEGGGGMFEPDVRGPPLMRRGVSFK